MAKAKTEPKSEAQADLTPVILTGADGTTRPGKVTPYKLDLFSKLNTGDEVKISRVPYDVQSPFDGTTMALNAKDGSGLFTLTLAA